MPRSVVMFGVIVVVFFIGVTAVMVWKATGPARPPMHGAMAEFKLDSRPKPIPAGSFTDADGKGLDLTAFKGKVTLVNFWATWCPPCLKELPSLDRLKHSREGPNFQVETISVDQGGQVAIIDYFKKLNISYLPKYSDRDSRFPGLLNFDHLPTTILLDADGKELGRYDAGEADWDGPDAGRLIDFYIAPKPAG